MRAIDHQPIEIRSLQACITQRLGSQVRDLFQVEHARGRGIFFRFVLCAANNGRMTFKTHRYLSLISCTVKACCAGPGDLGIRSQPRPAATAFTQKVYFMENVA